MNDYNLTDYTLCERDYKLLIDAIKDEIQLLSTLIEHNIGECDSFEVENTLQNHPLILLRSEYEDLLTNLKQQNFLRA